MRRIMTLFFVAALTILGASGPALADDGDVAWTVRTASNSYGADRSSFSYAVNPGGQVKDAMVVANRGKAPLNLAVYAADGFTTDTGQVDLLVKDKKSVGVGVFLHADRDKFSIKPGETVTIPFTMAVPSNATPGDYVGGIVTSLTQAEGAESINVERRLGIMVKLRVSGQLNPALAIEDFHVDYAGTVNPFAKGDATVSYSIHNTGNTILSASQAVSVSGPFGWLRTAAGKVAAPPQLFPGESWKVSVPVSGVAPALRVGATVSLSPLLTDPSGSTSALDPVEATAHGAAVPWTLLVLVVVLIALVVGAVYFTRHNRAKRKIREDARVQEAIDQALRDQKAKTA
ncbi:uncharacterized protein DUF916 [Asanoa ferruginea]|uniref:Uncharacterized protein DUF916 n=1 Tax=Asanoa ferruginea TaxID=53367 RepID=A0A3D9ZLS7_9ACTN|nr:DUF916 domain-containing protein [Asanoa ferruginea]REF97462.1 uncharacterized protein DUF916 [Asanoa ferruginea]GIF48254.1 hypothetical protein Afe04nite_27930 [Asanoa ferruginea]